MFLLSWCNEISKTITVDSDENIFNILVEVQMLAYSAICAHQSIRGNRLLSAAKRILMENKVKTNY